MKTNCPNPIDMHWLIYSQDRDGRLNGLRIVESSIRPHALTLNDGFKSEQEALDLMGEYLAWNHDGFARINEDRIEHHVTFAERVKLAYRIEPNIVWLTGLALCVSLFGLLLIVLHIFGS